MYQRKIVFGTFLVQLLLFYISRSTYISRLYTRKRYHKPRLTLLNQISKRYLDLMFWTSTSPFPRQRKRKGSRESFNFHFPAKKNYTCSLAISANTSVFYPFYGINLKCFENFIKSLEFIGNKYHLIITNCHIFASTFPFTIV